MDDADRLDEPRITRSWLITFADLLCLLLAFFVMMSAMQKVDRARWTGIAHGLSRSLDPDRAGWSARPLAERNASVVGVRPASDLAYLEAVLADRIRDNAALAGVALEPRDERLVIVVPEATAPQTVAALATLLGNFGNAISARAFASDGRVAAMQRATRLALALRDAGYTREIPALGLSGARRLEIVVRQGRNTP